jgi:hypothetical protein
MAMRTQCFRGSRGMDSGQSAENRKSLNGAQFPTGSEIAALPLPVVSAKDRLEYIADMVQQRNIMSAQANCEVLAELLEWAYREAVRQGRAGP